LHPPRRVPKSIPCRAFRHPASQGCGWLPSPVWSGWLRADCLEAVRRPPGGVRSPALRSQPEEPEPRRRYLTGTTTPEYRARVEFHRTYLLPETAKGLLSRRLAAETGVSLRG